MITVICSKWGSAFGPEYVNRLAIAVQKHLHIPHAFVCFTDNKDGVDTTCEPIEPLWEGKNAEHLFQMQGSSGISCGYPNLYMFRRDFPIRGRILYLDLDVLVTGDLGPLVTRAESFMAIHDWWSNDWNGSVMLFTGGFRPALWDDFPPPRKLGNGQEWLSMKIKHGTAWPDAWVRSYKIHGTQSVPDDCRVLVFHGHPKMEHFPPEHWVSRKWKEND
jgi:hypothetical protein